MARVRGTKRQAVWVGVAGATGAGLLSLLRGHRNRRLKSAMEGIEATVLPPGQTAEPVVEPSAPGEGHAPGHQHLLPPPEEPTPARPRIAGRGYRSGHRDRGGRSIAFRTKRGR